MRLLSLLCLSLSQLAAQPFTLTPAELLRQSQAARTTDEDDVVLVRDDVRFEFQADGRSTFRSHRIYRILNDEGKQNWAAIGVEYSPWYQSKPKVRARVVTPDGAVHALDLATLTESGTRERQADMFNDRLHVRGPLPAIAVGAVVEEEIVIEEKRPSFEYGVVRRVTLGGSVPVERAYLEIDLPDALPFRVQPANLPESAIRKTTANGRTRLVVDHGPIAGIRRYDPHLPSEIIVTPSLRFATGKSWQEVAQQYGVAVDQQLAGANVKALVEKGATRDETIRKLLARLHQEIRYTGVEFGEAAWVPRKPAETLQRKYGDCKDKSALLVAMLREAGIPAHLALLEPGPGLDVDPALPGMGDFGHAIVYVPGAPAYWIDATDELAQLGELAEGDQGRLALVIDPATTALVKTPELPATARRNEERREFFLADQGPARVVETSLWHGTAASSIRNNYLTSDAKTLRDQLEGYVKDNYLAEKLTKLEHGAPADLSQPFQLRLEVEGARRGYTDPAMATVAIRRENLVDAMPEYLRTETKDPESKEAREKRTHDLLLPEASLTEWHYRIHVPRGFRLRELPKTNEEKLGTTLFREEYRQEADGTVTGVLRFDTGKRRLTAQEAKETRTALLAFREREPLLIEFDQTGEKLLQEGKIREALAEFQSLLTADPKSALAQTRIARALLAGGLGEAARVAARRATELDAKSATSWSTLGWTLQHDLVGRLRRKGFDLAGALAAYQKAVALDSKSLVNRADYAILLEHNPAGVRYGPGANMAQAITEYRAIAKEVVGTGLANNLAFALLEAGRFADLKTETEKKTDATGHALYLAALASLDGPASALTAASRRINGETDRRQALASAANFLLRTRNYPPAADLFAAAAKGQTNAVQMLNLANVLRKTQRHEQAKLDLTDPANVVLAMMRDVVDTGDDGAGIERVLEHFSQRIRQQLKGAKSLREFGVGMRKGFLQSSEKSGLSAQVGIDLALSALPVSQEGNDRDGYRVRMNIPGQQPLYGFLLREDGRPRLLAFASDWDYVGQEALRRARAGDLAGARKLLDWVREITPLPGGDDPLAGSLFARLWERGSEAPLAGIEVAAAALMLTDTESATQALEILDRGAKPEHAIHVDLARAGVLIQQKKFKAAIAPAQKALAAKPLSDTAFSLLVGALGGAKESDRIVQVAGERLQRAPGDALALRTLVGSALEKGDWAAVRRHTAELEKTGNALPLDWNNLAWSTLYDNTALTEGLKISEKALTMAQNQPSFPLLHTLAAIQAESGKTTEARELMLQAMEAGNVDEPNSECWYVFARIAEHHGVTDAARTMYQRVTKDQPAVPASTAWLARQRLAVLGK